MQFRILVIPLIALTLAMSGCANRAPMAFSDDAKTDLKTSKPIFLMTSTLRNTYRTSFQPKLLFVNVEKAIVNSSADHFNFVMDDKAKNESDSATEGSSYLLRMELEQGEYVIRGLTSHGRSFPIQGLFFTPLHSKLVSKNPGVLYIGHVEVNLRERQGEEFKAGPSFPLIDQAIIGASTGTFDVEITDQWDKDGPKFLAKFPILNGVNIQKAILPPFDRKEAQRWWEVN